MLGGVLTESAKFGFSWFIPALIKYKTYFSDVFVASFFIQLVGLESPIFFQVVIKNYFCRRFENQSKYNKDI